MTINILTLFPSFFSALVDNSIVKRAIAKGVVNFKIINIRDYSLDKNHRVDDHPTGGGAGLIIRLEPIMDCLRANNLMDTYKILLTPKGITYNQKEARRLSEIKTDITLICGHYEGIDSRFEYYVDEQISIGDYILTGGEIGAMVIADSITRLLPGAIAKESTEQESFDNDLLEYPQYTYPIDYEGHKIPDILFSGNHEKVNDWRLKEAMKLTIQKRPDLIERKIWTKHEMKILTQARQELEEEKKSGK